MKMDLIALCEHLGGWYFAQGTSAVIWGSAASPPLSRKPFMFRLYWGLNRAHSNCSEHTANVFSGCMSYDLWTKDSSVGVSESNAPLVTTADTTSQWMSLGGWGEGVGSRASCSAAWQWSSSRALGTCRAGLGVPTAAITTAHRGANSARTPLSHMVLALPFCLSLSLSHSHALPPALWCMHTGFFLSLCSFLSRSLAPSIGRHFWARLHSTCGSVHSAARLKVLAPLSRAGIGSVRARTHTTHSRRCNDSKALRTKAGWVAEFKREEEEEKGEGAGESFKKGDRTVWFSEFLDFTGLITNPKSSPEGKTGFFLSFLLQAFDTYSRL